MPLSSVFVADLTPCRVLRARILAAGWLLHLLGVLLILRFSLPPLAVFPLAGLWAFAGGWELIRFGRAQHDLRALRLAADGNAEARCLSGDWEPLQWLKDGLILDSLAWLRFRRADGGLYCELFLRRDVDSEAWRRLQVIGRYAGPMPAQPDELGSLGDRSR